MNDPEQFSLSFECKELYGISMYVFNSNIAVEHKIESEVEKYFKKNLLTSIMTNDPGLIQRYFKEIFKFSELPKKKQKLLEFNRSIYGVKKVDVIIYPDISKLDSAAIKQAMRFSNSTKVLVFCSKEVYEKGKKLKTSEFRTFIEKAIKDSNSNVVL